MIWKCTDFLTYLFIAIIYPTGKKHQHKYMLQTISRNKWKKKHELEANIVGDINIKSHLRSGIFEALFPSLVKCYQILDLFSHLKIYHLFPSFSILNCRFWNRHLKQYVLCLVRAFELSKTCWACFAWYTAVQEIGTIRVNGIFLSKCLQINMFEIHIWWYYFGPNNSCRIIWKLLFSFDIFFDISISIDIFGKKMP